MASTADLKRQLEALTDRLEPQLARAFQESFDDVNSRVIIKRLVDRLERGDIAGAIAELHIDNEAFRSVDKAILEAYDAGGIATEQGMPKLRDPSGALVVWRWNLRNLRGEQLIREFSSREITNVT